MNKEEVKFLVERYPYLMPRNIWTDEPIEDYDYRYIIGDTLPRGWQRLFLQMCEDIREPLIKSGFLNKFRFTQVKEKNNSMRCYHCGAPEEVHLIIAKYEVMASYICTHCGRPATCETQGYLASYCNGCWEQLTTNGIYDVVEPLEFKADFTISGYCNGCHYENTISFKDEWERYIKSIGGGAFNEIK